MHSHGGIKLLLGGLAFHGNGDALDDLWRVGANPGKQENNMTAQRDSMTARGEDVIQQ